MTDEATRKAVAIAVCESQGCMPEWGGYVADADAAIAAYEAAQRAKPDASDLERAHLALLASVGKRPHLREDEFAAMMQPIAAALTERARAERERCAEAIEIMDAPIKNIQQACVDAIRTLPDSYDK